MSERDKPREFWIPVDSNGQAGGTAWVRDPKEYPSVPWDFIHVIEASYARGLEQEIENHKYRAVKDREDKRRYEDKIMGLEKRIEKLREALTFYAGEEPGTIVWRPGVCDSYSGLQYHPDWNGNLADEPQEIAVKALKADDEAMK